MTNDFYDLSTYLYPFDFNKKIELPILKKIKSFKYFKKGWHYNEGVAFDKNVINESLNLSSYLYDNLFNELDAFPGFNGEILIKTYFESHCIEIFINKDLSSNYIVSDIDGEELFNSPEMSIDVLKKQILSQRQTPKEWKLLGYYPSIITKKNKKSLPVLLSETHPNKMAEESLLFAVNALSLFQKEYASILETNIQSIPTLPYTGSSTVRYYPLEQL